MGDFVGGDFVFGDFVTGKFFPGGFCHGELCRRGILSWGILSLGDFVTGDFVMGDFDPIPYHTAVPQVQTASNCGCLSNNTLAMGIIQKGWRVETKSQWFELFL